MHGVLPLHAVERFQRVTELEAFVLHAAALTAYLGLKAGFG